ncbi:MAG TPA: 50S ribosomal protein L5 [Candidatus Syntrophosphaera thermopropionivorans]|jgi:large subunit ribosomal protein L5|uniref:50S ribosomal protein L5 n=1 Tax=Candidatus Syntrophosphaera thermopropionivorans TaxID=2593015 RepID=A0AC61QI57_9BACT|nr:50S ribosomal protein L5 [Candidatus Syntrophosphaera thermopropionivorans]HRQ99319.1 50S ribosomal protein L5 [Candidatus Syntrophosphaera sp.]TDF72633.1 50S ribosomal protein L5 [Candidatus Syntrophosphaera thermopropionivorans]HNU97197.1 50S ribosomal protein L5 [Candidatus Syntrophosphaera thermopropionivorans]HNZ45233.1 50S ribosomal protein L5 [Candidatus Syntrophosphaera thermopropionivorans]HOH82328.1 50S ribosomal protein L5 [Candidatus Syntrophosphaera thermopropionivorans]
MNRLKEHYKNTVIPNLQKQFNYKNVHQVPKLDKIVVSMGVGAATQNKAILDNAVKDMEQITGRKPIVTRAKKSISNFKLRKGMPIGCKVTLRDEIMYEFFDRLVSIVIPRIRDFHGIPTDSFDGRGNFSIGLKEQTVFPEIEYDKIDTIRGLNINIITTARTDEEGRALLKELGMPFQHKA